MKKLLLGGTAFVVAVAFADTDSPDLLTFRETGYHANGWFDYQLSVHSDGDGILYDRMDKFLVSPLYPAPIRRVVLSVKATATEPSRYLRLWPLVNGVEVGTNVFDCAVTSVAAENNFEFVSFEFDPASSVDGFRLGMDGSGTGNWRVGKICVASGAKKDDEDGILKEFAKEIPAPANLTVADFTKTSLKLTADAVADAVGYRFRISRLQGTPLTTVAEDFDSVADDLKMSAGWTRTSINATLSACTESTDSTYVDDKGSPVKRALKIAKGKSDTDTVTVEIVSPAATDPVTGYSFVSKRSRDLSSNTVIVYGRRRESSEWEPLDAAFEMSTTMTTTAKALEAESDFVQVKFVFSAQPDKTCRPCALDTLRVFYGGNERRETVVDGTDVYDEPVCLTNDLPTARYECQVQAVAGPELRDSAWTLPLVVDLAWADLTVAAPTGLVTSAGGGKLTVTWEPVPGADHYLVDVVSADDPDMCVVRALKTTATTLTVAVPEVGDYAVTVTAVTPGGRCRAASETATGTVTLDQLGEVTAEAQDRQTIAAAWKTIPLAESYQAKLIKVSGDTETVEYGWRAEDGRIVLPEGWSCHTEWESNVWTSSSVPYPRLKYTGCWLASPAGDLPITRLVCRYKCGSSSSSVLASTRLKIEVSEDGDRWTELLETATTTKLAELTQDFEASRNIRCVRFTCGSTSAKTFGDVDLGKLSLTYGEETHEEVDSVAVTKGAVEFRNLDPAGRYRVVVVPQPSEGCTSASATIDLAAERFRTTGAVAIGGLRDGFYAEDFSSLSNQTSDVEVRKAELDYWQFFKGSGAAEKLLYTAGTNRTTGGTYAFGDGDARLLGTLATGSFGCSVGLAFRNDRTFPVRLAALSFDSVQRSFRANPATYALEALMTDGATGIDTEGVWRGIPIPETAPYTAQTQEGRTEYRQSLTLTDVLPEEKIPAGGVLILRWRHEKGASGPMMAIGNVKVEFRLPQQGLMLLVR